VFDPRPRSLKFRFVTAMAGALGIGADLSTWSPERRLEAAEYVALYKEIREIIQFGEVDQLGSPRDAACAVQYTWRDTVVVLAWSTGVLAGTPDVPGRSARVRPRGLDALASYVDQSSGARYGGAHLTHVGLPLAWTAERDAAVVRLVRAQAGSNRPERAQGSKRDAAG
jgi:alpha-galactosidase